MQANNTVTGINPKKPTIVYREKTNGNFQNKDTYFIRKWLAHYFHI